MNNRMEQFWHFLQYGIYAVDTSKSEQEKDVCNLPRETSPSRVNTKICASTRSVHLLCYVEAPATLSSDTRRLGLVSLSQPKSPSVFASFAGFKGSILIRHHGPR